MQYISKKIIVGEYFYFFGKVKISSIPQLSVPEIIVKADCNKTYPIYKTIKGVPSKIIREAINIFINEVNVSGFISPKIENKYGLFSLNNAVKIVHNPANEKILNAALLSIQLNYLVYFISVISLNKEKFSTKRQFLYKNEFDKIRQVIKALPFALTEDQSNVLKEVLGDLTSDKRLSRLLMGDVGSGKTIIAFLLMYFAALSGYQTALMAPTEILANQHFVKASEFFIKLGIGTAILTGSQTASQRKDNVYKIKNGLSQVIIGTHALFSADVDYKKLALIIIDEQHRFGVNQRSALEEKTQGADILVMSATPIPRTLALTIYANLDKSELRSKPSGRIPIISKFVPRAKTNSMIEYLIKDAEKGNQTFVVCPRIEDEENYGVENFYKQLKKIYNNCAFIHGKMKEEEKSKIMNDFMVGNIGILISTTVIEVGVDVPNAVNMVIFDAERFGLSQLHQLRGRVGRGNKQSYCFILSDNQDAYQNRLKLFCESLDGFELSEHDFKIRGAGDFFGTRQHGQSFLGNIDEKILLTAKNISDDLLSDEFTRNELALHCNEEGNFIKNITLN